MSYQLRPTQPSQQGGGYDAYNGYGYGGYPQQPYAQQQHPDMMHAQSQPPSPGGPPLTMPPMYNHDGLVRTQTWIANQPPAMSPPPPAKTPFSECTGPTDSSFDRRTLGGYSATMPPRPPKEDMRVLGIKRNHFFIVLAVGLFILVAAFAIGLGVGLGTRKSSSAALDSTSGNSGAAGSLSSSSISATPTTPTTTTSTTPTSTKVSPTPSFTGTLIPGPVICPQNNNTVYVSHVVSKPFNVQCGRDYSSQNGALDIGHAPKSTMAECIDACGTRAGCVGVGWGYYQGSYECWFKSKLGEPNWSSNWYFAQLQDMPES
ncbi:hypothetical protein F4819DRAFT_125548 [Hypoxylon fuscum]|nr:hypothetical protein F4819DRAFT_125548 [Hypoxylon fuscum]